MPLGFYKPDSVHPCGLCGHFSHGSQRAEPCRSRVQLKPGGLWQAGDLPPVCLASRGACHALVVTFEAVGSYPTFSPLPEDRAVSFLWRYPSARREPGIPRFHGARCLVMSGLSSAEQALQRPPEPKRHRASLHKSPLIGKTFFACMGINSIG